MSRPTPETILFFILVVTVIVHASGLLREVEGYDSSYIVVDVSSPKWIMLNESAIVKLTIKSNVWGNLRVEIMVKAIFGYVEVLYPTQSYVVDIPPHGTKTLDIALKGVKEGEELVIITVTIPEFNYHLEKTLRIPVISPSSTMNVHINLYAAFSMFHVELYRRPERAEVYLCDLKASHLRDNKYAVEIPVTTETCNARVSKILGFDQLSYDIGKLIVYEDMDLVIPDYTLSITSIVFSFLLLIPMYYAHERACKSLNKIDCSDMAGGHVTGLGVFSALLIIFSLIRLDLFLHLYIVVYELLFIIGSASVIALQGLRKKLSKLKKIKRTEPVKRAERAAEQPGPVDNKGGSKPLETVDYELLQVVLRTRVKSPPRRECGEVYAVPAEFRELLKVDLPSEMCLVNCGAYSCVYACGEYAIKIPLKMAMMIKAGIKTLLTLDQRDIEVTKKEVEKVYSLDHDNIIKLVDYSINPPILVYELADGTLADFKDLDLKTVLTISIQISEALRYIHSRAMVHGDLKPSNVLISKGVVKLGDFSSTTYLLSRVSGSGLHTCTPGYCAPEQIFIDLRKDPKFRACENRIDIYQLANVILSMLGIEPLDGSRWNEEELESRLSKVECEDLRKLLSKMLSIEPWSRPSAEEVLKSLLTIWKETSSSKKRV